MKLIGDNLRISYPDIQPFYKAIFSKTIEDSDIKSELDYIMNFFNKITSNKAFTDEKTLT